MGTAVNVGSCQLERCVAKRPLVKSITFALNDYPIVFSVPRLFTNVIYK